MNRVRSKSVGEILVWGLGGGILVLAGMIILLSIRTENGEVTLDYSWVLRNPGSRILWILGTLTFTTLIAFGLEFMERILGRHG